MPVKGFDKIEDHDIEKIVEMYGKYSWKTKNKIIKLTDKVPYVCDTTNFEFEIAWRRVKEKPFEPHMAPARFRINIEKLKEDYILTGNFQKACRIQNLGHSTAIRLLTRMGESFHTPYRIPDHINEKSLKQDFLDRKLNISDIMEKHRIGYDVLEMFAIKNNLKKRGFRHCNRRYNPNDESFREIKDEASAYFLGLMFSDGAVSQNRFMIGLQMGDTKIIKKFSNFIFPNGNPCPMRKRDRRKNNHKDQSLLEMSNLEICQNLIVLGCEEAKSLTVDFKKNLVEERWYRHILRGLFDGDGCVSITKRRGKFFINTINFLSASRCMADFIYETLINSGIECHLKFQENGYNGVYEIYLCNEESYRKLFNYLYKDATYFIDRKFLKYVECLKHIERNTLNRTAPQKDGRFFKVKESKNRYRLCIESKLLDKPIREFYDKDKYSIEYVAERVNELKKQNNLRLLPRDLNWINYSDLEELVSPARIIKDINVKLDSEILSALSDEYNIRL